MSQTLNIANFSSLNVIERTKLTDDVVLGATTLPVENTQNFISTAFVVVGRLGSETSEKVTASGTVTNTNIPCSALVRAHYALDPVTRLFGDQIAIYRAPNVDGSVPADNAFSLLIAFDIDIDQTSTSYIDAAGGVDYWYKFVYKNSTTSVITNLSDATAARGGGGGNYCTLDAIRKEAGFSNNLNITDEEIDEHRQAAQAEINGALSDRFVVPFPEPTNPYITDLTKRLAAGFLLLSQYGSYTALDSNNGNTRVDRVRAELKGLQEGTTTLVGATGSPSPSGGGAAIDGWPNQDTAATEGPQGGGERMFRVSDVSGNGGRY